MIRSAASRCWLSCLFLLTGAAGLHAQKAPYDVFPPAEPPYYRVRYEASTKPGELVYAVNYTLWIPPGVKTLRGVLVHQHGCGEGSCKSGLTGAYDLHWQALARKHDCALLAPAYEQPDKADCQMWCDPRNGSDAAFQKCLADLGAKSGHPELARAPWALWGHSGGGHWAGGMVLLHPDRVAAAWLRSGVPLLKDDKTRTGVKAHAVPDAALKVPLMCNLGTKEGVTDKKDRFAGVWPANEAFFNEIRGKGGLIGVAVDPLTSHECGNQRYLAIPWLDACLSARLPRAADDPLQAMPKDGAWIAPVPGGEAAPAAKYTGEPLKAAWLPNEAIAKAWMEYVKDTKVTDATPPPAPTNVRLLGDKLMWEAEADVESGLASFVIERDGEFLANVPEQGKNPFGRPVFQNLQYSDTPPQPLAPMEFTDKKAEPGKKHTYRVLAVNTAGLKSKPSAEAAKAAEPARPGPIDLKGKTLAETFNELLPKLDKDNAAQQRWQDVCFQLGAPGNEKLRAEACALMVDKLDPKTPNAARLWLLKQLERIGHEESVGPVAAVLDDKDDEVREAAVRALANNPSPKATGKLSARLSGAPAKARVGLLNALGHRGDPAAAGEVARELKSDAEDVAVAAARALGRIPGADGLKLLAAARGEAKGRLRAEIGNALIVHADRMAADKDLGNAAAIYKLLNTGDEPRADRLAALRGVIQTSGDKAGDLVLEILAGNDAAAQGVAVGQIGNLSSAALKTLAANFDKLPAPSRASVVAAVAARGDRSQLPFVLAAAKSDNAEVRRAGVLALGRIGDASVVEFLLGVMAGKDALADVAAESLAALPAEGVNEKLITVLEGEKSAARAVVLIGVLERRKAAGAVPALLKGAGGGDVQVRTAAFNGLKALAGPEQLPGMVAALLKTEKGKDREQAEQAVAAVAQLISDREKRAEAALAAIKDDPKRTTDLLPLLGRLGGLGALKLLRGSLADSDLRDAALAGLCNWPDVSANDDLLPLAAKGTTEAEKLRALQALIRVNTAPVERTPEERLAALKALTRVMELATRDDERRALLEGLGNVRHIETLRYLVPYLDQPALSQSACKGIVELAHSRMLREPNREEFGKALDRVIALCKDKGLVDRAKQYKEAP